MIELRWYQIQANKKIFQYWKKNKNKNPVVAIPTGAGKSLIIADLIRQCIEGWNIKILVLSHRKEILAQNKEALMKYIRQMNINLDIGLYSAGLESREIGQVTIAGIQSVYNKEYLFEDVKLIIIDEAHLIPPSEKDETMYNRLLSKLNCKCVGFTATPYRLGSGYITGKGHIFDDIIMDITQGGQFNRLVKEGYLTNLITKKTLIELDAEKEEIKTIGGDFSERDLSNRFDRKEITKAAVSEIVKQGENYKKWLIFAIDINHAEHIVEELADHGVSAIPVHSKMDFSRDASISGFKNGKIKVLVNVNILTTGIDVPDIDLIALLRPTKSPVLYVQSVGRGLRIAKLKDHCLVLDFARVVQSLGPINKISVKKRRKGTSGDPVTKTCPECDSILAPAVRDCPNCGHHFEFKHGLSIASTDQDIIQTSKEKWYKVDKVYYFLHQKKKRSLKVVYQCGLQTFTEWICVEHGKDNYAKIKANKWIDERCKYEIDNYRDSAEGMKKIANDALKIPTEIKIWRDSGYPEVIDYKFN